MIESNTQYGFWKKIDTPYLKREYAVLILEKFDTPYPIGEYAVLSIRLRRLQWPITMQKTQMQKYTMQTNTQKLH